MRNIKYTLFYCLVGLSAHAQTKDMLDVKIGQMLMIGFPEAKVDSLVLEEVKAGKVGAIIFFEKNIPKSNASFAALKKMIWTYQKASPIPLMIAIDQEGGKVNRLKDKYGFTRSITAQEMGKALTLDSVKFYAEATAATLAGLGFNVNFAPVVDLAVNPKNTVIVKVGRSFSANPDSVALFAEEFIKPHRKFGVTTVLKHFPGHGSSLADTHFGVADVTKSWSASELIPYQRLIGAGAADAIMSAHIVNMQLDPRGYPGTLSSRMIDSLLRKQLRFDGVVFSDDMQMQAIAKQYGLEEAVKLAINAGIDVLCFSNNIQGSEDRTVNKVHSIIRTLVNRGQIKPERIDEAFTRILKLKSRIGVPAEDYLRHELEATRKELADLKTSLEKKTEVKENKLSVDPPTVPAEGKSKKKKKRKS
jgi:beta-N-acetylhexosaminidase